MNGARSFPVALITPSMLALLTANLGPVAGVWFFAWDIGDMLLLYWGESVVIGLYTLLKLGVVTRKGMLFLGPFFILHFGGTMLWFLGVILMIDHEMNRLATGSYQHQDLGGIARGLAPALCAFMVSHGISFFTNFMGRREYVGREAKEMMMEPYRRVGPMLGMVLLAGIAMAVFGNVGWLLLPAFTARSTSMRLRSRVTSAPGST